MKKTGRLIACLMLGVVACGVFASCNAQDKGKEEAVVVVPGVEETMPSYDGQYLRAGGEYELSSKVAFLGADVVSPTATGNEYTPVSATLTATVSPPEASQKVEWSVAFKDAGSQWASGKTVTDYVTIEPASDYSKTATVTCLAPFGEVITITVRSHDFPSVKATCQVDFVQKFEPKLAFGEGTNIDILTKGESTIISPWELYKTTDSTVSFGGEYDEDYDYDGGSLNALNANESWPYTIGLDLTAKVDFTTNATKMKVGDLEFYISPMKNITEMTFDRDFFIHNVEIPRSNMTLLGLTDNEWNNMQMAGICEKAINYILNLDNKTLTQQVAGKFTVTYTDNNTNEVMEILEIPLSVQAFNFDAKATSVSLSATSMKY